MADLQWNKAFALEQTAGDEELLNELLELFQDSSASDLEQLQQAVATNNPKEVVTAAHSLKGSSASLGLESIRQIALVMEADAREDSVKVAQERVEELASLLEQIKNL